jgi:hypothetical protein
MEPVTLSAFLEAGNQEIWESVQKHKLRPIKEATIDSKEYCARTSFYQYKRGEKVKADIINVPVFKDFPRTAAVGILSSQSSFKVELVPPSTSNGIMNSINESSAGVTRKAKNSKDSPKIEKVFQCPEIDCQKVFPNSGALRKHVNPKLSN